MTTILALNFYICLLLMAVSPFMLYSMMKSVKEGKKATVEIAVLTAMMVSVWLVAYWLILMS